MVILINFSWKKSDNRLIRFANRLWKTMMMLSWLLRMLIRPSLPNLEWPYRIVKGRWRFLRGTPTQWRVIARLPSDKCSDWYPTIRRTRSRLWIHRWRVRILTRIWWSAFRLRSIGLGLSILRNWSSSSTSLMKSITRGLPYLYEMAMTCSFRISFSNSRESQWWGAWTIRGIWQYSDAATIVKIKILQLTMKETSFRVCSRQIWRGETTWANWAAASLNSRRTSKSTKCPNCLLKTSRCLSKSSDKLKSGRSKQRIRSERTNLL